MRITLHNYEIFFIDHYEGKLSVAETEELMAFLASHPDLKAEFKEYDDTPLSPDHSITLDNKAKLKKSLSSFNRDEETIMAFIEGDLSDSESLKVQQRINDDREFGKLFTQYKSSVLVSDENISYADKSGLKKKIALMPFMASRMRYAAAAVIILLIGLSALLIFMPASEFGRSEYALFKLDRTNIISIDHSQGQHNLIRRAGIPMQWSIQERETIVLNRMPAKSFTADISTPYYYSSVISLNYRSNIPSYQLMDIEGEALASESANKTTTGKILSGFFSKIKSPFKGGESKSKDPKNKKGFSIWDLAEYGVKGVNALGDHEYTLVRRYNEDGNVKGVFLLEE